MPTKYEIAKKVQDQLDNTFTYHAPFGDQAARYEKIRDLARGFAMTIAGETPVSREQSMALSYLQLAVMCANAAIACNEVE